MPEAWWHHATALAAAARGAPANATPATLLVHTNALEATVSTFAARPQDLVRAAVPNPNPNPSPSPSPNPNPNPSH